MSDRAMQALYTYDFPGNVRELENALAHGVALCRHDVIELGDLPRGFAERASSSNAGRNVKQLREENAGSSRTPCGATSDTAVPRPASWDRPEHSVPEAQAM